MGWNELYTLHKKLCKNVDSGTAVGKSVRPMLENRRWIEVVALVVVAASLSLVAGLKSRFFSGYRLYTYYDYTLLEGGRIHLVVLGTYISEWRSPAHASARHAFTTPHERPWLHGENERSLEFRSWNQN